MKKAIFILTLMLGIIFGVFCQNAGPMDLVVVLDTSASMSSHYRETSDYLIGPFLKEFLRIGDTFHLISFAGTPRVEISRRVEAVGDVEAIIGRLLLMYPLDPQSDVGGALDFAEKYSSSLPGSRPSKLVLVTDGDAAGTESLVNAASGRLKGRGADLQYIKVPVTGTGPSSGRPQSSVAQTGQAQQPSQPPSASQQAQGAPGAGQTTQQPSQPPSASQQVQGAPPGAAQGQPPQTGAPASQGQGPVAGSQAPGAGTVPPAPPVTGAPAASPSASTQQPSPASSPSAQGPARETQSSGGIFDGDIPLPLIIALAILALLILGLIIFFAARHLQSSPGRVMAQAASPVDNRDLMDSYAKTQKSQERPPLEHPPKQPKPLPKDTVYDESLYDNGDGPIMLNLFVENQNTAIGRRNIHAVKSGYTFSVGGGKSDFLIFLVPVPPHIADVQFDGRNCTLIPRNPKYFPDIGSQAVPNCIGKTIRVVSDRNYELFIRMERYQDPLKALNKMLNSISVPGEVK